MKACLLSWVDWCHVEGEGLLIVLDGLFVLKTTKKSENFRDEYLQ